MEPELHTRITNLEEKIDAIYVSVERTRKYFLTTLIISIVMVVLPLIGLIAVIPSFLSTYTSNINSLTQ